MRKLRHKLILATAVVTSRVVGTDVEDGAYFSPDGQHIGKTAWTTLSQKFSN